LRFVNNGSVVLVASFEDIFRQLDSRPHVRGDQFEKLCKWYLENEPRYRRLLARVWPWQEWPERRGPDAGIDLVAETVDGELWAIQAKCYDADYDIKKRDIDSFLSESSRPVFAHRLLMSSAESLGRNALRVVRDLKVGVELRGSLCQADVEWPESPDELAAAAVTPFDPKPHQDEAIRAVTDGFAEEDRGQLIMACGTGKTLTAMWVAEAMGSHRTLVLVPSLSLLGQTLRAWATHCRAEFDILAVCSDETVAGGDDAPMMFTSDLGLPVTTEVDRIKKFLLEMGRCVVFSTYHSSLRIAQAFEGASPVPFDLIVADEAHHCVGARSTPFTAVLDPAVLPGRHRLFMTATPRYFTNRVRRLAGEVDLEVASMDDRSKFGPVFHKLTFGEAIEKGLLTDYQLLIVGVSDDDFRRYAETARFVLRRGGELQDAHSLASSIALAKAMREYDLRRLVTFHSRVVRAKEFADGLPEIVRWMPPDEQPDGRLWCDSVSGRMSAGQRGRRLTRLAGIGDDERGVLSNARCLGEGVDVPTLDGIAFIDPRRSQTDIVQAVGRAIRLSPDKKIGTIVLAVYIGDGEDAEVVLSGSEFNHVWQVLRALRDHDDTLAERLDALRRGRAMKVTWSTGLPGNIVVDLPVAVVGEEFINAFEARLVDEASDPFEFWFRLIENYVERMGTSRVPLKHREDGHRLGGWVLDQRQAFKKGRLSEDKAARLGALPNWSWAPREDAWQRGYQRLCQYVDEYGRARVPSSIRVGRFRLGQWVIGQRQAKKNGRLATEKVAALEGLPDWSWDLREDTWDEAFSVLMRYVGRVGDARVPYKHNEDEFALGTWVVEQRQDYKKGQLSNDQRSRLKSLPEWSWDPAEEAWDKAYALLMAFVGREGHCHIRKSHKAGTFGLGSWVYRQRDDYKKGRLAATRIKRLKEVRGWSWEGPPGHWETGFAALQKYEEEHGHVDVPTDYMTSDQFPLGRWTTRQRYWYNRGDLSADRIRRLEGFDGWEWSRSRDNWERRYAQLQRYVKREGDARVPYDHVEGDYALGQWVSDQRRAKKKGRLSASKISRLKNLKGWTWTPEDADWERGFGRLRDYEAREEHCLVPKSHKEPGGFRLGAWVRAQRAAFKSERLSPVREAKLKSVEGWSWDRAKEKWDAAFAALEQFVRREKHARVPRLHREGDVPLGNWVVAQRQAYKQRRLSDEQIAKLKSQPRWLWDRKQAAWDDAVQVLRRYIKGERHAQVPRKHKEGEFALGSWVGRTRRYYRKGELDAEKIVELNAIPEWTWEPTGTDSTVAPGKNNS